ncbi:MAG: ferrochelatase [Deferribacteraceae bacterium]|jgi:ferrochelatase|nr:ferrochelatase [Deferribacteraceae bacterium]
MKDAVIALGMGGPSNEGNIEPFLFNILSDRELIDFHIGTFLQRKLAGYIARRRAERVKPRYKIMGGGSPQLKHTEELLAKLRIIYQEKTGIPLDTFVGMCYFRPYIKDTVRQIGGRELYRRLYLFPLYPQYCSATTGIAFKRFYSAAAEFLSKEHSRRIVQINGYHNFPSFIETAADRIKYAARILEKPLSELHILFSAHGIPEKLVKKGDPYPQQIAECVHLIAEKVKPAGASVGFQSRVGFARWLKPSSHEAIAALAAKGVKDAIIYPISFINDHIETLYDIDVDLISYADKLGVNAVRAPSFNSSDDFAEAAAEIMIKTV